MLGFPMEGHKSYVDYILHGVTEDLGLVSITAITLTLPQQETVPTVSFFRRLIVIFVLL